MKFISSYRRGALALLGTLLVFSFLALRPLNAPHRQESSPPLPTKAELWRNLRSSGELHYVYPGADETIAHAYDSLFAGMQSRRYTIKRFRDRDYPADSIGTAPLRVFGAIHSNLLFDQLLTGLPLQKTAHSFRFHDRDYHAPEDLFSLTYPNPFNPQQQLRVITGNRDEAIITHLKNSRTFRDPPGDYWLVSEGQIEMIGFFEDQGPQAWRLESATEYRYRDERDPQFSSQHFQIIGHGAFDETYLRDFADREEVNLRKLLLRVGFSPERLLELPQLQVHLWDSFEKKALLTGNADLRHADLRRNAVHLIITDKFKGDDFFAEALWFIATCLPRCESLPLREGLAVALSDNWRGQGHNEWAARLVSTGNAVPIEELFDKEIFENEAPLYRQPLLGALVDFLLQRYGAEVFLQLYERWPLAGVPAKFPDGASWQEVKSACHEQVIRLAAKMPEVTRRNFEGFYRGFCFAHEGYQIHNGYMGNRSHAALLRLAAMGTNAISVTPFGYLRDANTPDFFRRSDGPNSENDESLLAAMAWAQELGMHVMLKPHVLMWSPNWGWPGEVEMKSAADWRTFFDRYERWMRPYAMLAEMYDFDSFCIGVELVRTTQGHENEWRHIIRRLRKLYSGPMVYAANWGEEFENLSFWNELDAIGLNCYYPLSEGTEPTDTELQRGATLIAEKVAGVAQRFQKKVLITEIGFASRSYSWQRPHEGPRSAPTDLSSQQRCYEAVFKAFWQQPWLAGIYWWKWPTDLEDGGRDDNQFTPNGKPAAHAVTKWYRGNVTPMTGE